MIKDLDSDLYIVITDPGGPKTKESYGFGYGSATLSLAIRYFPNYFSLPLPTLA
jgi:hypothetical protein